MPVNPVSAVTLQAVGQSWTQASTDKFGFTEMPNVSCLDRRSGRTSTTYEIPNLDNALDKLSGLRDWEPGQALPVERTLGATPITFQPRGVSTRIISRATGRNIRTVFRDLETNIVPILLTELYGGIDRELATILATAANWTAGGAPGVVANFTDGAGAVAANSVDEFGGDVVQPDEDMMVALRPLRKFQGLRGMSLECVTNSHVLDVFSRSPTFTGAGAGSGIASRIPTEVFIERFMAVLRLDRLHIMDGVVDENPAGLVSDPNYLANGLCWFGLLDRRGQMDLRNDGSMDAPDGALYFAQSRDPEVVSWLTPGMETESFTGRAGYDIYIPRNDFGVVMNPVGPGGIFAVLPG